MTRRAVAVALLLRCLATCSSFRCPASIHSVLRTPMHNLHAARPGNHGSEETRTSSSDSPGVPSLTPSRRFASEACRRDVLRNAAGVAAASALAGTPAFAADNTEPAVTDKIRFKVKLAAVESSRSDRDGDQLEKEEREIVVGLYGRTAPGVVENFLSYCVNGTAVQEGNLVRTASFEGASFWRSSPGEMVEIGKAVGLKKVEGVARIDFRGRLFPDMHVTESDFNQLQHDRRGLLTRGVSQTGPDFSITFAPAPQLDSQSVVFGRVLEGDDVLAEIENVATYSYHAAANSGELADTVFQAQREAYVDLAKMLGDTRAKDLRGNLLRKVEIEQITRL